MRVDEFPEWGALGPRSIKGTPVTRRLYVADVDDFVGRAVDAGATITLPIEDLFWGDRYGMIIEDPVGHRWSIATPIRDVGPDELRQAALAGCG